MTQSLSRDWEISLRSATSLHTSCCITSSPARPWERFYSVNLWNVQRLLTNLNWVLQPELPQFHNQVMTNSPERLQRMTHKDMIFEMLMRWRLYRVVEPDRVRKSEIETVRQRERFSVSLGLLPELTLTVSCWMYKFLNHLFVPAFVFHDFAMSQSGRERKRESEFRQQRLQRCESAYFILSLSLHHA